MIKFQCPKCGQSFTVADDEAGKKGKCPKCSNIVAIPNIQHGTKEELPNKPVVKQYINTLIDNVVSGNESSNEGSQKTCENCGRLIGKLERSVFYQNHIVCGECYNRLCNPTPSQPLGVQSVVTPKPSIGDDATLNIRYMQMKKSVLIAMLLNLLWAGWGIYYAKCPKGRSIVKWNVLAFLSIPILFGTPCFILFIWSSIICYEHIQLFNFELLEALRTGKLDDFNNKYALV
jgi:DNA-directed RNA polymerase subunit M/transcription elongation factor TFIIS